MSEEIEEIIDPARVNPTPPDHDFIVKAIKACAMVGGMTKTDLEKTIKEQWLYGHPERIKQALAFMWSLYNGKERMPREVIRAGRKENNMTFTQVLKKKLKGNGKHE